MRERRWCVVGELGRFDNRMFTGISYRKVVDHCRRYYWIPLPKLSSVLLSVDTSDSCSEEMSNTRAIARTYTYTTEDEPTKTTRTYCYIDNFP